MAAAMEELNEFGSRFTMSNLASRLAISKRTLYEHFESKEVLIESIVDAIILDLQMQRQAILDNHELSLPQKLVGMLSVRPTAFVKLEDRVKLDLRRQFPGLWKRAHESAEAQWDMIDSVLREGIEVGCFRPVYVPVVRKILQGAVNEITEYGFLLEQRQTFQEMIGHITDIVIYGIMLPEKQEVATACWQAGSERDAGDE
jgi:AcrR family transcriptional regulator